MAKMCPRGQVLGLEDTRGQMLWLDLGNQVLGPQPLALEINITTF